jgi:hypothetical protein
MADHHATWVRLREVAWQCFPNDDLAAEIVARELFNAEETIAYVADLYAQVEEQGVLDTVRAATHLRGELREELQTEDSSAGGNKEKYMHLDDDLNTDDLTYLELPTDKEAAESAVEQWALMASFETQCHDASARRLMAPERRAAEDELAVSQQRMHQSAYLCNMAGEAEARAVARRRLQKEERARAAALARACQHQYPSPPTPTVA